MSPPYYLLHEYKRKEPASSEEKDNSDEKQKMTVQLALYNLGPKLHKF